MDHQRVSEFPSPKSAQRISQQFYESEPLYSAPPPSMSEPPRIVKDPVRAKQAQRLFAVVFLPMLLLLVFALVF